VKKERPEHHHRPLSVCCVVSLFSLSFSLKKLFRVLNPIPESSFRLCAKHKTAHQKGLREEEEEEEDTTHHVKV
jgi:hypothetical protein